MPAEWENHAACLMAWPTRSELWGEFFLQAKADYAAVARAIARFEPVFMVCAPADTSEINELCGNEVRAIALPIDDSWIRDNGPIFVRDARGDLAVVKFGFNAWGERWHPYGDDAQLPERLAAFFDLPLFVAPMVLEGGSIFVDGEGTLLTTEQCLLNPNRNPSLSKIEIEENLRSYLGASRVIWLPFGKSTDAGPEGTDGHVDLVAQYVSPGHVLLEVVDDPTSPEYVREQNNLSRLSSHQDARERAFTITSFDPGTVTSVSYLNHYLANNAVIVGVSSSEDNDEALAQLAGVYQGRTIIEVPGETIARGGGGPHCITQQIPAGTMKGY